MLDYDEMSEADLKAEIAAREAEIKQIDALGRAATASRQWERALDLDDERSRTLDRLTLARGYLFRAEARARGG
jgi:hypothetical protein